MTFKQSLLKNGLIRHNIKRFWWISVLHGFFLFLAVPYTVLNNREFYEDWISRFPEQAGSFLIKNSEIMFLLLVAAAVLVAVCVFRYLQTVRSATLFHALPVKRSQLYLSALASGFILLAMPIVLNGIILLCMSTFGGFDQVMPIVTIFDWIGGQLLTGTAILCLCTFAGVFTGSSVAQVVFTFVLCFAPLGVVGLTSTLLDGWLFGFTSSGIEPIMEFMLKLQPIYYPQFLTGEPILWIPIMAGVYIVLFVIFGLVFYYQRDTEHAGDVVAFSWINPIFLYGVTFCSMLLGTVFFAEINGRDTSSPNVLLMLLFALIGYAVAKMLILKSFRIAKYYKGYVVFALLALLVYFAVDANVMGFGTTVPDTEDIRRVYAGDYIRYQWREHQEDTYISGDTGYAVLENDTEIDMVRAMHQTMIDNGNLSATERIGVRRIYLSYELENGRVITRQYYGFIEPLYEIYNTSGAKDSMFPNFRKRSDHIRYLNVLPHNGEGKMIVGDEMKALIACIQADLEQLSYEEIVGQMRSVRTGNSGVRVEKVEYYDPKTGFSHYSMEVGVTDGAGDDIELWFQYNSNFKQTIGWLTENGYLTEEN